MKSSRHPTRPGFTLFEMIIVMVILGILFTLIVPRLAGNERRELQLASEQVADLLLMFARREAMGAKPVALMNDEANGELLMLVLDIDDDRPGEPADWRIDRAVPPVRFPVTTYVAETRIDGHTMKEGKWMVSFTPGQERQAIEITLATDSASETIVLPASGLAPRIMRRDQGSGAVRTTIDLDASGRHREDW